MQSHSIPTPVFYRERNDPIASREKGVSQYFQLYYLSFSGQDLYADGSFHWTNDYANRLFYTQYRGAAIPPSSKELGFFAVNGMNKPNSIFRTGIGQNSHCFLSEESSKPCIIGGVIFEDIPGLHSDSDGDVIFHAICNAITSLSGVPILGGIAKDLCRKDGITDSQVYLERALETLERQKIVHIALSIEGKRPYLEPRIGEIKRRIASILKIELAAVGITASSGAGLTDFGCGDGLQCFCVITTVQ